MSNPIRATVTLDEDQIKEAVCRYLRAEGFETSADKVLIQHCESGRLGVTYCVSASCQPVKPDPAAKPFPFQYPAGVRGTLLTPCRPFGLEPHTLRIGNGPDDLMRLGDAATRCESSGTAKS